MRKLLFLAATVALSAQVALAQVAPDAEQVKGKLAKSDKDIENPKKQSLPKTWINRGDVFCQVVDVHSSNLRAGMTLTEASLLYGKPQGNDQATVNGQAYETAVYPFFTLYLQQGKVAFWKETNFFVENPYAKAFESYDKAYSLDIEKKNAKKIKEGLNGLKIKFNSSAMNNYSAGDYLGAFQAFEGSYKCSSHPVVAEVDSLITYYTGLTAQLAGKNDDAIKYLNIAKDINYVVDGELYYYLFNSYMQNKDTVTAGSVIETGFAKYPTNKTLMLALINYYIVKNESPVKVIGYLDKAIDADPQNASLYFAKAALYEKLPDFNKAVESYKKAIEMSPEYFDATFNLGVLYYNTGAAKVDAASKLDINDTKGYDKMLADADVSFKAALPYIEKSYQLRPNEIVVVETLKNLYFRFRNDSEDLMKKYIEFKDKHEAMKSN